MQIVSVVTLLLGIFAYSLAVPQYGNYAGLSAALAQLAQQLAKEQGNTTITVGNSSTIVSGVSSSIANAHIDADRNQNGYGNNGWGNNGWGYNNGYWRGVPDEEIESDEYAAEEAELEAEIEAELNAVEHDVAENDAEKGAEHDEVEDDAEEGAEHDEVEDDAEEGAEHDEVKDDVDSKEE